MVEQKDLKVTLIMYKWCFHKALKQLFGMA